MVTLVGPSWRAGRRRAPLRDPTAHTPGHGCDECLGGGDWPTGQAPGSESRSALVRLVRQAPSHVLPPWQLPPQRGSGTLGVPPPAPHQPVTAATKDEAAQLAAAAA